MNGALVDGIGNAHIEFYFSGSGNYELAVQKATQHHSYQETTLERTLRHHVTFSLVEVEAIIDLWDLVKGWSSSRLYINGERATKRDLVYKGLGCYSQQKNSDDPIAYCYGDSHWKYNIWGCWQLGMSLASPHKWIDYGVFDSYGAWHLDKARIKHELLGAMRNYEVCPAFNKSQVLHTLEVFPDSINPKKDKLWEYVTSHRDIDGRYREVATGIRPVLKRSNYYIINKYSPSWQEHQAKIDERNQEKESIFVLEDSEDVP